MSKKGILQYTGLFGEDLEVMDEAFVHYEPLNVRTVLHDYKISEHVHSKLYQIFFITSSAGMLLSAGKKIALESPCALIIPNNKLHGFVFQSEIQGDVFTLNETFFENMMINNASLFLKYNQLQYFSLSKDTELFTEIYDYRNKIIKELNYNDSSTALSLSLLLQLFFIRLERSKTTNNIENVGTGDRTLNYFYQFNKLIKQFGHERKPVHFYANKVGLSTVHLNRICQSVSQKSAIEIIHENLIQEAKKYLVGTSYSVAEIAYVLGFKDPAHFSKFFKMKECKTPGSFRKNN